MADRTKLIKENIELRKALQIMTEERDQALRERDASDLKLFEYAGEFGRYLRSRPAIAYAHSQIELLKNEVEKLSQKTIPKLPPGYWIEEENDGDKTIYYLMDGINDPMQYSNLESAISDSWSDFKLLLNPEWIEYLGI